MNQAPEPDQTEIRWTEHLPKIVGVVLVAYLLLLLAVPAVRGIFLRNILPNGVYSADWVAWHAGESASENNCHYQVRGSLGNSIAILTCRPVAGGVVVAGAKPANSDEVEDDFYTCGTGIMAREKMLAREQANKRYGGLGRWLIRD
ncbi:MAG: hypothetical protein H0U74_19555 [Bradymonadaceae bacterium]|nr:hypothetical protein [Lujinxingiaceae bacterium]